MNDLKPYCYFCATDLILLGRVLFSPSLSLSSMQPVLQNHEYGAIFFSWEEEKLSGHEEKGHVM